MALRQEDVLMNAKKSKAKLLEHVNKHELELYVQQRIWLALVAGRSEDV